MKNSVKSLEEMIGERLRSMGQTLSVAESCTGGFVSDRITNIAGSSDYFEGGIVSYSMRSKAEHLRIPLSYLKKYGAVSHQVARQMAEGVRQGFGTAYGLSTTGVAGPTGGTKKTPVGTVFIGFSDGKRTVSKSLHLKGSRREVKEKAAEQALRFLHEQLVKLKPNPFNRLSQKSPEGFSGFQANKSSMAQRVERLRDSTESQILIVRKASKGISGRTGRLGIFPASFNPPTMAHLALVRETRRQTNLDEILILLDIQAMDKAPVQAEFEDRLAMLKKVFGRDPEVSIGIANQGLFLQKLKPIRKYYPFPISISFIVGFDTILRVIDKKYYRNRKQSLDELFKKCRFLVANRDPYHQGALEILLRKRELKGYGKRISFITLPSEYSSLSSSVVRGKVKKGESVDRLVPSSVHRHIKEKGLYTR